MRSKANDPGQSGRQGETTSGSAERSRQPESGQRGVETQRQPGSSLARRGWMRGGPLATPWDLMRRATAEMERMLEAIDSTGFAPGTPSRTGAFQRTRAAEWIPQIEVIYNTDSVTVRGDLPGVDLDDIEVGIEDNMLVVSGVRKHEEREEREGFVRTEREYGRFFRVIPLPEGADESTIEATFDGGVLEINVPVRGRQQEHRIPVSSGTASTRSTQQSRGTQSSQQSRSQQQS